MGNELLKMNPWWSQNYDPKTAEEFVMPKRYAYKEFIDIFSGTQLMIFIKGLRRTGKSTLLKQAILELVDNGVNGNRVLYVLFSQTYNDLETVLKMSGGYDYLFLDEIQYCPNWKDQLKVYYDIYGKQKKIVFTGSATLNLTDQKESLLGRFMPVNLPPLPFREYIWLKYRVMEQHYPFSATEKEWEDYISYGEFPELLTIPSQNLKNKYLKETILDPLTTQDIELYDVEKKTEFLQLLKVLAQNTGQILNKTNIASEIGLTRVSVDRYISIACDMGLIYLTSNYYPSVREQTLSDKKVYFTSLNLALVLLNIYSFSDFAIKDVKGHIFENYVANIIKKDLKGEMFYLKRGPREVDLYLKGQKLTAYEVKYQLKMHPFEIKKYKNLGLKNDAKEVGIIYTGKTDNDRGLINFLNL